MVIRKLSLLSLACLAAIVTYGRSANLIVAKHILLPRDTVVQKALLQSLDSFLVHAKEGRGADYVLQSELAETSVLLDEMTYIEQADNPGGCHTHLLNCVRLTDSTFLIQLAVIRTPESGPVLNASFTLLASQAGGSFFFYSPLKQNTAGWKQQKFGNATVHFKQTLDRVKAKAYICISCL
jgi:hypothetical protein